MITKRLIKKDDKLVIEFNQSDIKRFGLLEGEIVDLPFILEEGKKEDFDNGEKNVK